MAAFQVLIYAGAKQRHVLFYLSISLTATNTGVYGKPEHHAFKRRPVVMPSDAVCGRQTTVHNVHILHVLYETVQTTLHIQDDIVSGTAQLVAPTTGAHWPLQIRIGHDATPPRRLGEVPSLLCAVRCVELIFKLLRMDSVMHLVLQSHG